MIHRPKLKSNIVEKITTSTRFADTTQTRPTIELDTKKSHKKLYPLGTLLEYARCHNISEDFSRVSPLGTFP